MQSQMNFITFILNIIKIARYKIKEVCLRRQCRGWVNAAGKTYLTNICSYYIFCVDKIFS